jgi:hypothetical protein
MRWTLKASCQEYGLKEKDPGRKTKREGRRED